MRVRGVSASEAETETSPGVLFSSGYIAGGTLCGLFLGFAFMVLSPDAVNLGSMLGAWYTEDIGNLVAVAAFLGLAGFLALVGIRAASAEGPAAPPGPPPEEME